MCPPPTPIKGASYTPHPPRLPPTPTPPPPLLFFLAQGMNCKSIQVFQQRCRVEEILLRFSRFCFAAFLSAHPPPPFTLPPFHPHPPLHLKNPMKPVECCRAFQHLGFFHPPQRPAAQPGRPSSPAFRGLFFAAPSRVLSFFISSSLSLLPTSSFLLRNL